jgi:Alr-MurF fusion protein
MSTLSKSHQASAHKLIQAASSRQQYRPTWIEIDTDALASNVRQLKAIVGQNVTLMIAVKANAYGHGAVTTSWIALANGADYLAVANLDEALELREHGIEAPILVLSHVPLDGISEAVRQKLTLSLYNAELATLYNQAALEIGEPLRVHVKLDTGMGRLGVMPNEVDALFQMISTCTNLQVEGIYTHFSVADEDAAYTGHQAQTFRQIVSSLESTGWNFRYIHAANSAATLSSPEYHFNMVRCGIATYGLHPSGQVLVPNSFKPAMQWKTVIAQVKTLPANHVVGYGNTYRTTSEATIAVLPIGYGDGFRRAPGHWSRVLVHGQPAPIIGRISMEKTTIDVSGIPNVQVGDEVVLLGTQGDKRITAEEIAQELGTSNYEVVCSALPRVPRI